MNATKFKNETRRIIKENKNVLVKCYNDGTKDNNGALLLMFTETQLDYYYISPDENEPLYDKLRPNMIQAIKDYPDKMYFVCMGPENYVATYLLKK